VRIVSRDAFDSGLRNALVCLRPDLDAQMYRLDGRVHVYAMVRGLPTPPQELESIAVVEREDGEIVSHVLFDDERKVVYLPFSIDEVIDSCHRERYVAALGGGLPRPILDVYYRLKRVLPRRLLVSVRARLAKAQGERTGFPAWPFEPSLEDFKLLVLKLLVKASNGGSLPFIWFWPEAKDYCLTLTHDVETAGGREGIGVLLAAERELGLRSSFNLVPLDYEIDDLLLDFVRSSGFEIGVHGDTHDGRLFSEWSSFARRVLLINQVAERWDAYGFRSPATHRNPDWFHLLRVAYDSSIPDTDPFEPQPGGCLSLFPYMIGRIVELPITMPQDHTLFALLGQSDDSAWRMKSAQVRQRHGVVCLLTHPDTLPGYVGDPEVRAQYLGFLRGLVAEGGLWNPLPRELTEWWRCRNAAVLVEKHGHLSVEGGSTGMGVAWATLEGDKLRIERESQVRSASRSLV